MGGQESRQLLQVCWASSCNKKLLRTKVAHLTAVNKKSIQLSLYSVFTCQRWNDETCSKEKGYLKHDKEGLSHVHSTLLVGFPDRTQSLLSTCPGLVQWKAGRNHLCKSRSGLVILCCPRDHVWSCHPPQGDDRCMRACGHVNTRSSQAQSVAAAWHSDQSSGSSLRIGTTAVGCRTRASMKSQHAPKKQG